LSPQTTATIAAVLVDEGQQVTKGQVLMRLDARTSRLQAAQASAAAAAQQVQAEQLASDYERMAKLDAQGVVAASKVEQLRAARKATEQGAEAAKAAASLAASMVGHSTVRAPFAGIVSSVMMEVGELATMMPPRVLLRLIDLSQVEVRVNVPEHDLPRISVGDPVVAFVPSLDRRFEGTVAHVGLEIQSMTRTAEVVTRIPNGEGLLRAGLSTELEIRPAQEESVLAVPRGSVVGGGDQQYVFVVEDCRAHKRPVKVTPLVGGRLALLDGIRQGERVVVGGVRRLADGLVVRAPDAGCTDEVALQTGATTPAAEGDDEAR
jgi:RND family efflux transporter MFP subunit